MAASKKVFWLGQLVGKRRVGRIKVDGKRVMIGESFTADNISPGKLSTLRKAGCIGDAPFLTSEPVGNDLDLLRGRISEMENIAVEQAGIINDLKKKATSSGDNVSLMNQINELNSEITRLTSENSLTADDWKKVGLTKKQKAIIKELEK